MPIIFIRDNGIVTESKSNYNDNNIKPAKYPMNDLGLVFSNWDGDLKKDVTTKNI